MCILIHLKRHGYIYYYGIHDIVAEEDRHQNFSFINVQCHNQLQVPLVVTASMLGLVSLLLLAVTVVAGIYISCRLCKRHKKVKRYRTTIQSISIFHIIALNSAADQLNFLFMKW